MSNLELILLALSLSVDSFVVAMCGSVTLGKINLWKVFSVAAVFAVMQTMLLFVGWVFGNSIVNYVTDIAPVIGFVLLLYIGLSMIVPALKKGDRENVNLSGINNILLAAVATSVDASAVGVSIAMTEMAPKDTIMALVSVMTVTFGVSAFGIIGGSSIGRKFGKPSQMVGGVVLVAIGVRLLFA